MENTRKKGTEADADTKEMVKVEKVSLWGSKEIMSSQVFRVDWDGMGVEPTWISDGLLTRCRPMMGPMAKTWFAGCHTAAQMQTIGRTLKFCSAVVDVHTRVVKVIPRMVDPHKLAAIEAHQADRERPKAERDKSDLLKALAVASATLVGSPAPGLGGSGRKATGRVYPPRDGPSGIFLMQDSPALAPYRVANCVPPNTLNSSMEKVGSTPEDFSSAAAAATATLVVCAGSKRIPWTKLRVVEDQGTWEVELTHDGRVVKSNYSRRDLEIICSGNTVCLGASDEAGFTPATAWHTQCLEGLGLLHNGPP